MADPVDPASSAVPDDEQTAPEAADGESEVEAHVANPLDLQEMGVQTSFADNVIGSTSATSLISCC
ncbi:hypothetical protein RVR_869 [Actinacidiphila reveromycinica]|uniref:Uncharacterized protein n=1 Tax=Actinacidiphila reveromycinica TaxID=659352 RepID=A0A7U3VLT1_9ACTN|nr:hypothetical protein [Streptomyces sp. SN-593]BBA95847.1 hypothetical protein RVR_869 [Streptomyces sp. SN-593]